MVACVRFVSLADLINQRRHSYTTQDDGLPDEDNYPPELSGRHAANSPQCESRLTILVADRWRSSLNELQPVTIGVFQVAGLPSPRVLGIWADHRGIDKPHSPGREFLVKRIQVVHDESQVSGKAAP